MGRAKGEDRGLFERPKGSGIWWVRYHDSEGKEHKKKIGPKVTAKAAYIKFREEARVRKIFPEAPAPEITTVRELVERYRDELVTKNAKSAREYRRKAEQCIHEFGHYYIEKLQPGDVEAYKGRRLTEGAAPATVNRSIAYLKTLFNLAVRDELTERNPCAKGRVRMLRENNIRDRILGPEEEGPLREALPRPYWLAILFALHTGLRQGEQFPRVKSDLDVKKRLLRIPDTKGGSSEQIMLNRVALAAVQASIRPDSPYLFPDVGGDHDPSSVTKLVQRAAKRAGLVEGITWHCFRHTFISRLAMAGKPITTIQRLARHKSIQMTLRYIHLMPSQEREASDDLADRWGPGEI